MSDEYLENCASSAEKCEKTYDFMFNGLLYNYVPQRKNQGTYARCVHLVCQLYELAGDLARELALLAVKERK